MSSPLLERANAYLLITSQGTPSLASGRVVTTPGDAYLVKCYLVRQQSNGTTSGADYLPTQSSPGDNLPGASGTVYLYEGYGLQWVKAPTGYVAGAEVPTGLDWTSLAEGAPSWLVPGAVCSHMQGAEKPKHCIIERTTGKYGNEAIDAIIVKEIGGIPLLVRSGDVID